MGFLAYSFHGTEFLIDDVTVTKLGEDKGAVVVLDRRIYEKKYGSMFIASMPPCKKMYAPLSELCKKITEFIFD